MNRQSLLMAFCTAAFVIGTRTNADAEILNSIASDTVVLDVNAAEQRLVSHSLIVLAAHYNVDIAKSEITQAKAWYNPNITYAQTLFDPSTDQWLDNNPASGQVDVQINQLISVAGRHMDAVKLAKIDLERSQLAFDDLARSLKFELYDDLADLYEDEQTENVFTAEINALDQVIRAMQQELSLGAAAGNDVIRLKAERQSTISDQLANSNEISELESRLRILLGYNENPYLKVVNVPMPTGNVPTLDSLLLAGSKRSDVLLANEDALWSKENLKLQKVLAAPDILVGTEYDRRSSYTNNLWMINAGIDIPIFNRNQGNIKAAQYALLQSQVYDTLQMNTAAAEVVSSYRQFLRIKQVRDSVVSQPGVISNTSSSRGSYSEDIDLLFTNAVNNYEHRTISLIEFLDQLRTYEEARTGLITLDSDYFRSAQQLNYVTGTIVIH
ncbi:MAG TPA: TolC family protein [Bacteroidia bacterium]|nr:TolC family protein [Bacteroidia bacterium]